MNRGGGGHYGTAVVAVAPLTPSGLAPESRGHLLEGCQNLGKYSCLPSPCSQIVCTPAAPLCVWGCAMYTFSQSTMCKKETCHRLKRLMRVFSKLWVLSAHVPGADVSTCVPLPVWGPVAGSVFSRTGVLTAEAGWRGCCDAAGASGAGQGAVHGRDQRCPKRGPGYRQWRACAKAPERPHL